mmetsp:Transcript_56540/g.123614  ORF Transcript_56540/g.123614 Transcript_56540/m.123614 type:complete len:293 (-) Transcript_56540:400-1278(-)
MHQLHLDLLSLGHVNTHDHQSTLNLILQRAQSNIIIECVLPADRQHDLGYMSPADFLYDALLQLSNQEVVHHSEHQLLVLMLEVRQLDLQLLQWRRCTPELRHFLGIVAHAFPKLQLFLAIKDVSTHGVIPLLAVPAPIGTREALGAARLNLVQKGLPNALGNRGVRLLGRHRFAAVFGVAPDGLWRVLPVVVVGISQRVLHIANTIHLAVAGDVRVSEDVAARTTTTHLLLNLLAAHDTTKPPWTWIAFLSRDEMTHGDDKGAQISLGLRLRHSTFHLGLLHFFGISFHLP